MQQALRKAYFSPSDTRNAVRSVTESALTHLASAAPNDGVFGAGGR